MHKNKLKVNLVIFLIFFIIFFATTTFASYETEKLLQKIIECKKAKPDTFTYINMGNFYCSLDLYEPAEKEYEKALNIDKTNILARINQSYALYKIGEKESALTKLSQIIIDDPNNAFAYYVKGMIYKNTLEYDLAIKEYEKVVELIPQNDKIISELAQLYQDNDQLIEATESYIKLGKLKSSPYILVNFLAYKESAASYLNLGDYYSSIGNIDQAISAYNKVTQFSEDKRSIAVAYYRLGIIDLKGKKYEQSIMEKTLAQNFYPLDIKDFTFDNFAQAFIEIGDMHYNAGELQNAYQNYELTLQLADSNYILSEAHYKLGLSYYRSQDYENAVREGEIALSLNPEYLSDQERLINLLIANSWSNLTKKIAISDK
jgi:tetratricopeptide (TPR) repeat protein